MSTYSINTNIADTLAADMLAASKQIQSLLNDQAATIQSRLADWVDGAADEYELRRKEWDQIAANMPPKLQYIKTTLDQIVENYTLTTKQGVSTWSGYSAK